MDYRGRILLFPPNRVWRTYPGGRVLDELAGAAAPGDGHFPEDWIGSVTRARNPGREHIEEGVSLVQAGAETARLDELLSRDPGYFLGAAHARRFGPAPQLLVKLLDSAVRLHFQCHPTAEFARARMGEPSGKAEAYHILAVREGVRDPYVHLGFQRPPSRGQLREWILCQDIAALEGCFDRIPVRPGDTLFIPGGHPHAIGEGILMVEIMEPSDLAVRFEFEKAGYVLPESARFMGRGLDFCLDVFDFTRVTAQEVRERAFMRPILEREYPGGAGARYRLIGAETTPCMRVAQSRLAGTVVRDERECFIGIVTAGEIELSTARERRRLRRFDKFLYPANGGPLTIAPRGPAEILECQGPA